ncbi:hypothetical protein VPNG_03498 [Cytospora leucostoma]|uniref:ribonuclease H n=1 Tax=Cytospora leucostoma TaxID=1230097 RepID=A0A423XCP0_9PEZI|nr:hypothetical protein VPNG_03498 [Cytospora leucostoma]
MVVAVDGACPYNGTDEAIMSACGVYLGPGADNWSWRVVEKEGQRHTSSRAELHAAIGGLLAVLPFIGGGGQVDCSGCETPCRARHVVIKSDSAYLVNSVTLYIDKWMTNGWRTAQRKPVRNRDLWEELIRLIHLIEDDLEAKVDFWHVPRGENQQADQLANDGLRSRRTLDFDTFPLELRGFTAEEDARIQI